MAERRRTPGDLMTPAQVAEYLQLHKLTIYKYIREGRLPAARIGRSWRILKSDVERLIDEGRPVPEAASNGRPRPGTRREVPSRADGRAAEPPTGRAPEKHKDEIYVGPSRGERGKSRDVVVNLDPIDWVVRGLH